MVMITDDIFTFPNMLFTLPFIVSFLFFFTAINSLVLQTTRKHFKKKKKLQLI